MDLPTFRKQFPEFADSNKFPDAQIEVYLGLSELMLDPGVWLTFTDRGLALLTAHQLYVATKGQSMVGGGVSAGLAGVVAAPISAKSVGSVSKSMDTSATTVRDGSAQAAYYNQSAYGIQFMHLTKLVGMQAMRQL